MIVFSPIYYSVQIHIFLFKVFWKVARFWIGHFENGPDYAISAAIQLLNPDIGTDYNIQIMIKNVVDGEENYISINDHVVLAKDNSGWVRVETAFTKQPGDQEAYIQVSYQILKYFLKK